MLLITLPLDDGVITARVQCPWCPWTQEARDADVRAIARVLAAGLAEHVVGWHPEHLDVPAQSPTERLRRIES